MVFEIIGKDITKLDLTKSHVITLSFDGSSALVFSSVTELENITIINTIEESQIDLLLQQPFWKQPCINC